MVNKVMLLGRLGADPEIRTTQSGTRVAHMRVATSERWTDKNTGEKRERTEWHSVVVFGDGLVNAIEKHLAKGNRVFVEGKLQTRKWQDQNGNDRFTTEVLVDMRGRMEFIDFADAGASGGGGNNSHSAQPAQAYSDTGFNPAEDVPF